MYIRYARYGAGAGAAAGPYPLARGAGALALVMPSQRRSAMNRLAASEVWYASQNTYALRSRQGVESGRQSPPTFVSTPQHDVSDVVNPALQQTPMARAPRDCQGAAE